MSELNKEVDFLIPDSIINPVTSIVEQPTTDIVVQNLEGKAFAYSSYVSSQEDLITALQLRRAALSFREKPLTGSQRGSDHAYIGKIFFTPISVFYAPRLPNYYLPINKFFFQNYFNYDLSEVINEAMNFYTLEKAFVAPVFTVTNNLSFDTTQPVAPYNPSNLTAGRIPSASTSGPTPAQRPVIQIPPMQPNPTMLSSQPSQAPKVVPTTSMPFSAS